MKNTLARSLAFRLGRAVGLAACALSLAGVPAAPAFAQQQLRVWWAKAFYQSEDLALFEMIRKFEAKYPAIKVELSQYPPQDMLPKTVAALDSGAPPDVAYSDVYDFQVTAKWAYEGKIDDLSELLAPMRERFAPSAVEAVHLYNHATRKRAYYAFPIMQQTIYTMYWKDMLETAGFKQSDIPTGWKDYWRFWCEKVQPAYRKKTGSRVYAVGQSLGVDSTDAAWAFLTFADAYNVRLVDGEGKLLVDDPAVRQGLIDALTDYTDLYAKGCVPPSAMSWKDPDNNVAFHNRTTVLTHNPTISIPGKWLDDMNNPVLTDSQRATARKNYTELIVTGGFPDKPDGSRMTYRASVKTGVIFRDARNKAAAKQFVAFLLDEANLTPYVEGTLGRWYPVTRAAQQRAFWQSDPHRLAVHKQFTHGTVPFEFTKDYRFAVLNNENVWAKAMSRVVNEKLAVDKAVDEMIARIKTVVAQ
ncbi:ABC transporter substrate-binding protein [Verminephrobacter aporrectodeae]|uniref:Carbohydrate ABC transporter substrate-binding protein n=1 Tax=Verminephrobacter aporrectodeae subsp. tuberculatae TaxID=1110392 RepID=A0ABT3KX04_9BURK|nr:ABC transporter substrate-binding protein [Verminephrobacter aporrectodeae]MCW5223301.1 carbohydrate ABC transporter substrate-binding protein [Verminephrobacter aporrectodeae subsp. tuberculatae]MCW5256487.1 carbohydrate ABC transporter substrate-binding protein [Verminephrobacter aporrectodeae subsp. tuberculatae]MCW5288765.1 carbohydrate ABC transporter substrate-binding protein [Verminephrobacter aporrectodeae subsp. tuberculatae]MCW5322355.1 carbohydrate ABC transporter substrate-bindin